MKRVILSDLVDDQLIIDKSAVRAGRGANTLLTLCKHSQVRKARDSVIEYEPNKTEGGTLRAETQAGSQPPLSLF